MITHKTDSNIPEDFLLGGAGLNKGHPMLDPATGLYVVLPEVLDDILGRVLSPKADTTALGAVDTNRRRDGVFALVLADNSFWRYDAASTASAGANVVVPSDSPSAGRWTRIVPGTGASTVVGAPVADVTALAAIAAINRSDGELVLVTGDSSLWAFNAGSSASAVTGLVVVPAAGTGRWFRVDAADAAITANVATTSALKGVAAAVRYDGMIGLVQADGSVWRFIAASTSTDSTESLVLTPSAGSGRWHRVGGSVDLKLPIIYTAADGATLFTVPVGFRLRPLIPFWEIGTGFTTGATGKAGISTSNAAGNTSGDLLGGASLDDAATLTAGFIGGTVGAKIGTPTPGLVLVAGNTIKWNKSSTFTAGDGYAHVPCALIA